MTETEDLEGLWDGYRATYTFGDFWTVDGSGNRRCGTCRDLVDSYVDSVPCCGAPYDCTDDLYVYACHRCHLIGDSW